jgi:riboflavin kinase/FMN adenylyltransferase
VHKDYDVKLIRDLALLDGSVCGGAVAIGNFDGVHRGHARIIERLVMHARRLQGPAVVFTFNPHPVRLLRPDAAPLPLTTLDRKVALMADLGVDALIAYPTDLSLLQLSAEQFFRQIVCETLSARTMVEGSNFCFGRGRSGDVRRLGELCKAQQVQLEIIAPLDHTGLPISSSRIRQLLVSGDVAAAGDLLTQPYRIRGRVARGAGRGEPLGFPTANLVDVETLIPALGVYAGRAIVDQQVWPAAIHIGPNPTFAETTAKLEVHLIGFTGSLYDRELEVDFRSRLRDIHTFPDVTALREQLQKDVAAAANQFGSSAGRTSPFGDSRRH